MRRRLAAPLALALAATPLAAQPRELPTVRATAKVADLRDGDVLQKGAWHIVPEVRPDVYVVRHVGRGRRVAIHTDVDSIGFDVVPGSTFDFVVLLGADSLRADSAFSRITAVNPGRLRWERTTGGAGDPRRTADTIPFRLGRGNKMYVKGTVNGSDTLDLMFDTGADAIVLSASGMKKAKLAIDGVQQNAGFGGATTVRRSSGNVLAIGGLRWRDVPIVVIDRADADGIVGYDAFEDRVVAIDHARGVLVVGDALPGLGGDWSTHEMRWDGNLPFVQATLVQHDSGRTGWFEFDTGAAWGMFVHADFARAGRLADGVPVLRVRTSRGTGPAPVETDLVRLATLRIGPHALPGVPIDVERPSGEQRRGDGIFGMDVLRRFDAVIDYRESRIHLRPNALASAPYAALTRPWGAIAAVATAALAVAGIATIVLRRRRGRAAGGRASSGRAAGGRAAGDATLPPRP